MSIFSLDGQFFDLSMRSARKVARDSFRGARSSELAWACVRSSIPSSIFVSLVISSCRETNCLSSGRITPSIMPSNSPRMTATGVRSSWATLAMAFFRNVSSTWSSSAISLKECDKRPISSTPDTSTLPVKSPSRIDRACSSNLLSGDVSFRETSKLPTTANPPIVRNAISRKRIDLSMKSPALALGKRWTSKVPILSPPRNSGYGINSPEGVLVFISTRERTLLFIRGVSPSTASAASINSFPELSRTLVTIPIMRARTTSLLTCLSFHPSHCS